MARKQLYIAHSLDGYIADKTGGVDWLEAFLVEGEDYGYADFLAEVGAVVMGATTYEQELLRGPWPYGARPTWVFSHRGLRVAPEAEVHFAEGSPSEVVAEIERATTGNIWLVGGGNLIKQFVDEALLDELILFVVPVVLGQGIRLFQGTAPTAATLVDSKPYATGLVELRYSLLS